MQKYQVGLILSIGMFCTSVIPFYLPRATYVGSIFPNALTLSIAIALAGLIVLVISIVLKFKPVPAYGK